jgi:hypothetical protein
VEVLRAARPGELARLGELVGDGDDVGRLAVRVEVEHRVEDELVLGDVEIDASHDLDDIGHRILAEQHAADRALLCEKVVRGSAVARAVLALLSLVTGNTEVGDRHDTSVCWFASRRGIRALQVCDERPTSAVFLRARRGQRERLVHDTEVRNPPTNRPVHAPVENGRETPGTVCATCVKLCG